MAAPIDGTFDAQAHAAYFYMVAREEQEPGAAVTQKILDYPFPVAIVLDFDKDDRLLGVEVLGAEHVLRPSTVARLRQLGSGEAEGPQ
jgi:hypothetical protein